jgi:hypothetical protein
VHPLLTRRWREGFATSSKPRISRPPEISSTVSAILVSKLGLRKAVQSTSVPSSIRLVAAASAARSDQPSQIPVVGPASPSHRNRRWSGTQRESKPRVSARCATVRNSCQRLAAVTYPSSPPLSEGSRKMPSLSGRMAASRTTDSRSRQPARDAMLDRVPRARARRCYAKASVTRAGTRARARRGQLGSPSRCGPRSADSPPLGPRPWSAPGARPRRLGCALLAWWTQKQVHGLRRRLQRRNVPMR